MSKKNNLKYLDIMDVILKRILNGVYPAMSRMPTHMELSSEFGVSTLTINRVLNELKKDGYIVSRRGSGSYVLEEKNDPLDRIRPVRICILNERSITQYRNYEYDGRIINGILKGFELKESEQKWYPQSETKFTGFKIDSKSRNLVIQAYGESVETGQRYPPIELVEKEKFDLVITVGIKNVKWLNKLLKINENVLMVENPEYSFEGKADLIYSDTTTSYFQATRYLFDKGCRRIHYVGTLISNSAPIALEGEELTRFKNKNKNLYDPGNFLRVNAYRTGMESLGLKYNEDWMHSSPVIPNEITQQLAKKLFEMPSKIKPDAVICYNGFQAKIIQQYFFERGESIDVVGASSSKNFNFNFNIYVDPEEIGSAVSAIAMTRRNSPNSPKFKLGVPAQVVINKNELVAH